MNENILAPPNLGARSNWTTTNPNPANLQRGTPLIC